MQVILLERIEKTGKLGEITDVKAGFARNFLIPQGKAKPATKANLAEFETIRAELEAKESASKEKATRIQEKMQDLEITISANASEDGKLFGSVGANDIAIALGDNGFEVEKRDIDLENTIRNLGEYDCSVNLWSDIAAGIKIIVVSSDDSDNANDNAKEAE